jgi:hypothetical protein
VATALASVSPTVPLLVGGQGVRNEQVAAALGADRWAPDLRGALAVIDEVIDTPARRHRPADRGGNAAGVAPVG